MKTHFYKLLFLFFSVVQCSLSAQVNTVELVNLNKIENENSHTVAKSPLVSRLAKTQPVQSSVTDSTSVHMIIPKQYNLNTMDSKPE